MRVCLSLLLLFVALITQSQAFLQEKLAILKNLKSGFEGGLGSIGGSSAGNYKVYGSGYNSGYGNGYNYPAPIRPLYNSGESYGRSSYYNTGSSGGEQVIKVIKVIVPAQQNSYASSGYSGANTYSNDVGYSSNWASASQPVQISQPLAVQPAPVQYSIAQLPPVQATPLQYRPSPVQVPQTVQAPQTVQVQYNVPESASVQVQQPLQEQDSAPQQVVSTQQVVQPQSVALGSSGYQQPQTVVKTLKLIVSEEDNGQHVGYAPQSSGYGSGYGANSAAWNQGQNNIGSDVWAKWQRGGIWQKLGC